MENIYLDNASSVPCEKWVLERFAFLASSYFANQESLSFHGRKSASAVKEAEEQIFQLLTQEEYSAGGVISGNTGSCVLAACVHGVGSFLKGALVTSGAEHPSLLAALKRTSALYHFPLYYCPIREDGKLDMDFLRDLLKKEKVGLAAFHHIQSETGCMQDLAAIRALLDEYSPATLFLADTIQSAGKYPLLWKEAGLDFAFVSGQKIGSPGGSCFLYRKEHHKKLQFLRSNSHLPGRCMPANILLLREILEKLLPQMAENAAKMADLKRLVLEKLKEKNILFKETIPLANASDYILHFLTTPFQGAILTRMLALDGISTAPGSACESESGEPSRTLQSMKIPKEELYNALRISFWHNNTQEEILSFADALACRVKRY